MAPYWLNVLFTKFLNQDLFQHVC